MPETITLDLVLGLLKKFWYTIPMLGLGIALAITSHTLSVARGHLADEAQFRHTLQLELGATSDDHKTLETKLMAELKTSDNRKSTLEQISQQALLNKQRADAADAALVATQAANEKKYEAAQAQINALEHRKPTGNAAADCKLIEEDSKAAWKDWK